MKYIPSTTLPKYPFIRTLYLFILTIHHPPNHTLSHQNVTFLTSHTPPPWHPSIPKALYHNNHSSIKYQYDTHTHTHRVRDIGRVYILPHVSLITYVFSLLEKKQDILCNLVFSMHTKTCVCALVYISIRCRVSLFEWKHIIVSACRNNAFLMSLLFSPWAIQTPNTQNPRIH